MRASVLINCFNYEAYVGKAIESVVRQTRPADEVVVVDDGSTDGSADAIRRALADAPGAKAVIQENQGQLSAFNRAFVESTGEVLFFLDADDEYKPTHLESCLRVYEEHPEVGFVFTAHETTGSERSVYHQYDGSRPVGLSVLNTMHNHAFVGSVTSTLSLRRTVCDLILPAEERFLADWRTRADNVVVWGASMVGCEKYYLDEPSVLYRIHGKNRFAGRREGRTDNYLYHLRANRLLNHFWNRMGYSDTLYRRIHKEFRTIPRPSFRELKKYSRIVRERGLPLRFRLEMLSRLIGVFVARRAARSDRRP